MRIAIIANLFLATGLIISSAKAAENAPAVKFDNGGPTQQVSWLDFSRDNKTLYSAGNDKVIRVWDVSHPSAGKLQRTLYLPTGPYLEGMIYSGALSPDEHLLAVGGFLGKNETPYACCVRLIDPATGKMVAVLKNNSGGPLGLAFSPNGKWLACGTVARSARLWDIGSAMKGGDWQKTDKDAVVIGDLGWVNPGVAFASDDRLVIGGYDGATRFWDKGTEGKWASTTIAIEPKDRIRDIACSPDGAYAVSAGFDRTLRLWDAKTCKFLKIVGPAHTAGDLVKFMPDSKAVFTSSGSDGASRVFRIADDKELLAIPKQRGLMSAIAASPDGRLLATSCSADDDISIFDAHTAKLLSRFVANTGCWHVVFSSDGNQIACGPHGETLDLRDMAIKPADKQTIWRKDNAPVDGLSVRKLDRATVGIFHDKEKVGQVRRSYGWDKVHCFSLVPNTSQVIVGSDMSLTVNDRKTGAIIRDLVGHEDAIASLAVSPDGRLAVTSSPDATFKLWNISTGELLLSGCVGQDGRWALVTPAGFYTASPGGERLIGWTVSQGPEQTPLSFSAEQLGATLQRPDVLKWLPKTLSVKEAQAKADAEAKLTSPALDVAQLIHGLVPQAKPSAP